MGLARRDEAEVNWNVVKDAGRDKKTLDDLVTKSQSTDADWKIATLGEPDTAHEPLGCNEYNHNVE